MSIAAVSNTGAVQLDSTVSTLVIPVAITSTDAIVVHIGVASAVISVASVTNSHGDTFTRQAHVLANREVDYAQGRYFKNSILDEFIEGEVWTAVAGAAVTSITVTLTGGAKFAVEVEEYSGNNTTPATAFPHAASAVVATTSAPSIAISSATSTSFISAGFSTLFGLNQAAGTNNVLRGTETGTTGAQTGVAVTCADSLSSTTKTVALAPASTESVDGISGSPGSPSAGQVTIAVPATYAVCAVEVHV